MGWVLYPTCEGREPRIGLRTRVSKSVGSAVSFGSLLPRIDQRTALATLTKPRLLEFAQSPTSASPATCSRSTSSTPSPRPPAPPSPKSLSSSSATSSRPSASRGLGRLRPRESTDRRAYLGPSGRRHSDPDQRRADPSRRRGGGRHQVDRRRPHQRYPRDDDRVPPLRREDRDTGLRELPPAPAKGAARSQSENRQGSPGAGQAGLRSLTRHPESGTWPGESAGNAGRISPYKGEWFNPSKV